MRHGLQLASIALLRLVGLNIDWGCLVPHCIMDSLDQWEFLPFFGPQWQSLCTALMAGNACRWGCARGLCTSLLHTPIKVTSPTGHKCHHRMLAAVHHEKSPSNYIVALRHVMLGKHDKALMVSYATFEKISLGNVSAAMSRDVHNQTFAESWKKTTPPFCRSLELNSSVKSNVNDSVNNNVNNVNVNVTNKVNNNNNNKPLHPHPSKSVSHL